MQVLFTVLLKTITCLMEKNAFFSMRERERIALTHGIVIPL